MRLLSLKIARALPPFNPRTPCGVRPFRAIILSRWWVLSIHAPLAGCDKSSDRIYQKRGTFQSTHPLRGATALAYARSGVCRHFNPRTPCGVRQAQRRQTRRERIISIHAPLAGCDQGKDAEKEIAFISIHAPLAGCNALATKILLDISNFNPRTPCGVRPLFFRVSVCDREFQSTHPLRGATQRDAARMDRIFHFNPRTPCGVRLPRLRKIQSTSRFQSTHPLRGATYRAYRDCYLAAPISIHAPLAGCDSTM